MGSTGLRGITVARTAVGLSLWQADCHYGTAKKATVKKSVTKWQSARMACQNGSHPPKVQGGDPFDLIRLSHVLNALLSRGRSVRRSRTACHFGSLGIRHLPFWQSLCRSGSAFMAVCQYDMSMWQSVVSLNMSFWQAPKVKCYFGKMKSIFGSLDC